MADERDGLDYWIRWQVPVCALIIVAPAIVAAIVLSRSKEEGLRPSDLWTPCWRKLHPVWLLVYRALVVLIMSFFLFQMLLFGGANSFYFYTQWTFTLVIIYFAIGTVISAHGCWMLLKRGAVEHEEANGFLRREFQENDHATLNFRTNNAIRLQDCNVKEVNEKRAGFWGYTMQIIYQICSGAVMLTDIVFWCLLVPFMSSDHFTVNVIMFCMHSLNAIFLLLDTVLNSLPFPWFRMAYFVLWSCTYVVFQWVLHACGFTCLRCYKKKLNIQDRRGGTPEKGERNSIYSHKDGSEGEQNYTNLCYGPLAIWALTDITWAGVLMDWADYPLSACYLVPFACYLVGADCITFIGLMFSLLTMWAAAQPTLC